MSGERKPSVATNPSRREFLKSSGAAVVGGALAAGMTLSVARQAHAAFNDDTIKIALIGCGGRGSGAAKQALSTSGSVKLIAMADAFSDKLESSLANLQKAENKGESLKSRIDVPDDRKFVGFDAYQKAIDCGADLIILATPPGFRPIHFEAVVKANKQIFTEKPVATDAPGIRRFLAANEEAKKKGLAVGVGLQRHHQAGYVEAMKRLHDGAIGDILATRVYWNQDRPWKHQRSELEKQAGKKLSEMEYQMRNWYYFVWLCGDHIVEQHIHNIDVGNWMKNGKHPISASGMGGSQKARGPDDGEIFDHHAVEFVYDDGSRMFSQCRHMPGCTNSVTEHAHGTKGTATLNAGNTYALQIPGGDNWSHPGKGPDP
ncbi:MAG TPA: Gfo/Idh/MocA family oxidoreductase, partial [Pirellulales bacterium]